MRFLEAWMRKQCRNRFITECRLERSEKENADRMLYQLLEKGYPSFMLHENGLYKVQTGAYQQIGNAVNMEQRLRDDGYSTVIVTK